ncbi:MAG: 2-oxoacid:acceptor oxidoreductase family protein [Oscillospiraceae bacterium]|jgi:2-oxoglutarate ferredoxin oxidoreductase subunit gamma|nr:2-oxoacid:acceptor oxidoreductase family protein [Oscillospiraceae bacterium]
MTTQILLAGSGGQGLLFAGKFLAYAAMMEGKEVSWYPSYGPEARGGTSNCSVILSDAPIGAPIVQQPDILMALNLPSYLKFAPEVRPGGLLVADSSMISEKCQRGDIRVAELPATQMAYDEGMKGLANMILIGLMLKETGLFAPETVEPAMKKCVPPSKSAMLEMNLRAIALGYGK